MKNVFKKLFSLMLVAVMLVSVLPMSAMAVEGDPINVRVRFVKPDNTSLGKWEGNVDGYGEEADPETVKTYTMDEGYASDYLTKSTVTAADKAAWEIDTEKLPIAPEQNDSGVWVYNIPMKAATNTGDGEGEGGGEQTPTSRDVTVNFVFGDKTIATAVKKDVDNEIPVLTGGAVKDLYEASANYDKDYSVADTAKTYPIASDNTCKVELKYNAKDEAQTKTITLWGLDVNGNKMKVQTITITKGELVGNLPTPSKSWKKLYDNKYVNGDYEVLTNNTKVNNLDAFADEYYAVYKDVDTSKDGLSKLYVKASLYSGSKHQSTHDLFSVILEDGTEILNWLITNNDRVNSALASASFAEGYQRGKDFFYNYDGSSKLTEPDTLTDGDKTVYVKLTATEEKVAKVLLYIHSKTTDKHPDTEVITGYVKNGEVTRDDVWAVIKDNYKTNSNTKIDGLYSKETWDQKVDGQKPTAVKSLTIDNKDYYEVHVILTNASSKADSSNPKTGDSIFMTVTVMTLSVSALAVLVLSNKKRMVK